MDPAGLPSRTISFSGGPYRATLLSLVMLAIGMGVAVPLAGNHLWLALAVWGFANTGLYPICQVRVMGAASHAQALAGTLNVSMANAGIGLGAKIGAAAINALGVGSLGYLAAAIAVVGIIVVPFVARFSRTSRSSGV